MYTYREENKFFINATWLGMVEDAIMEKDIAEMARLEDDLRNDEPEPSIQPPWSEFYEDRLVFSTFTFFKDSIILKFKTTDLAKRQAVKLIKIDFSDIAECEDDFLCVEIDWEKE